MRMGRDLPRDRMAYSGDMAGRQYRLPADAADVASDGKPARHFGCRMTAALPVAHSPMLRSFKTIGFWVAKFASVNRPSPPGAAPLGDIELSRTIIFIVALAAAVLAPIGHAAASERVTRIVEAYGGGAALGAISQVESEWVGYFYGRYQSRHIDPPYDRMPIRAWSALDLTADRSASDAISTYPGELNLGLRVVNDGKNAWTMNTIARLYAKGAMFSHDAIVATARNRMPWMLARDMARSPEAFEAAGTRTRRGITYDLLRRGETTIWVHPETSLIHAISWREADMADVEVDAMRTYTDYFRKDGVMVNRRVQAWANDEVTTGHQLYSIRFNRPVDPHMRVPEGFLEVPSLDGYNGVADIGVERIGDGLFLAGDGETRVLYVEFVDHFAAMEAGGMPDYAERTYDAMRPHMGKKPLRYIVPTHHHDDHAVALHFYARIGATILTTRDKEGFLRRLLARAWGDAPPVANARFRFIEGSRFVLEDKANRLDIHVYEDAPHTANMLVGYLGRAETLYTCDVFIGWIGDVRQGASHGARHLASWVAAKQRAGALGAVRSYPSCHGRAYSAAEFSRMLAIERSIVTLPGNEVRPSSAWFERYGLGDDTARRAPLPEDW